ncbi:nucleotidyltransferase domain-containing protein [Candidatus Nanohalobium constans]|uniref:Nucleotidyltransferase domain-containing protein n=1 Tax=Candidatus Nanohalobium constans TaxID=2565781 RepID=A0A5Q0UFW6_9ARCH|nr:nucleotidyltransferase domain-containing protein [Candidatus Nanohalobium constans]QGA80523.1 nucleotidyltransferase domain-containing protein [Candidatus Nanohalobium constans]
MGDGNEVASVRIDLPLPDERVFSSGSVSEILELLVNNPYQKFSKSQLQELTGRGWSSTQKGVEVLGSLDLITTEVEGKKNLISLNTEKVDKPSDPIFSIPQDSFREPVRRFKEEVLGEVDYVAGILVFGSVARGEADRASDIDVLVIVEDDLTSARRQVTNVVSELEEKEIGGQRYEFEALVESVETTEKRGERIRNIFSEGLVLHRTKKLENLKEAVFG